MSAIKADTDRKDLLRELRRNRDTLVIVGTGVITFGVWTVVKILLHYYLDHSEIIDILRENIEGYDNADPFTKNIYFGIYIFVFSVILAVDLALRFYIGRSAIAEGRGIKKGRLYIVLTGIMALFYILALYQTAVSVNDGRELWEWIVTMVVDSTSMITLFEMAASALKVKSLEKRLGG